MNVYQGGGYFNYASRMSKPIKVEPGTVLSEALTDLGVDFIERYREGPFFLFLAHYDVHVQLDADSALIEKYLAKEKIEGYPCNAVYAAMVEHVDHSVGRILDKLEELDLTEKTMVVFFSDNGGLISRFDRIPLLAGSKQYIYEGDSLLPVLAGAEPDAERAIYWHYPVYHHDRPASAIRKGDWKLIHYLANDSTLLYNLAADIGETSDLSRSNPEKTRELMALLDRWREEVAAEFPVPNPAFDPEKRYQWGIHPDRKN